jgi:hypothetical protein
MIATLLRLSLIWLPGINLEWVFADGAQYFESHDPILLKHYFLLQANTLGMPLLASAFHRLLPFLDQNAVLRLLSASSFLLLGYSLLTLYSLLERDYEPAVLLAVVFLNPLIWTFGGRGTADLFPAALTLFAITLFWQAKSSPLRLAVAITAYGIAIAVKYHAVLLLPLIGLEALTRRSTNIRKAFLRYILIVSLILVIPVAYIIVAKQLYGFWLLPPAFRAMHGANLNVASILTNMIGYGGYLSLLLVPYSLFAVWERVRTTRKAVTTLVVAMGVFVAGFYRVRLGEEMRFGPLDAYVDPRIYSGALLVFTAILILISKDTLRNTTSPSARRYILCMVLGVFIFIAILSLTRPAQRYLLFVLPLAYFFVINNSRRKFVTGATILLYGILNLFITLSQLASGTVAQQMVQQITARGLLDDTEAGVLLGNAGNRFPDQVDGAAHKPYTVIAHSSPKAICTVESHPAPLVRKVLSLVRYEDAPVTPGHSK